jgi:hypothetical protein
LRGDIPSNDRSFTQDDRLPACHAANVLPAVEALIIPAALSG